MYNFRTDLASERRDIYQKANNLEQIDGIEATKEDINENIKVERVKITNENGEKAIGKPMGDYITIDIQKLKIAQEEELEKAGEILKGIVDNIHPKLVIVIDALASRSIERISSTVQLSDTGIVPGAGVGNTRNEISQKTLGIPVVAIGIPTVVETAVLVNDCLDLFITKLQEEAKSNDYLNQLKQEDNYEEIKEALVPKDYNLIVTPKEIDVLIENMTQVVATGINRAM